MNIEKVPYERVMLGAIDTDMAYHDPAVAM